MHTDTPSHRSVSTLLTLDVGDTADLVLAIAVADRHQATGEELTVELDGAPMSPAVIRANHGGRLHQLRGVQPGRLEVAYRATVVGATTTAPLDAEEWYQYIRPSRYCESDRLAPLARAEFGGHEGFDLLATVSSWVAEHLDYVPGSSRPTDGAVATLLARSGVCRDFAHLTVALLRSNGMPARAVSVYAPGLHPMDFHAVVEACVDDEWYVVDPTRLAPRASMVRIATGADAADTAFLTTVAGSVELVDMEVSAVAEPTLPADDPAERVQLR